MLTAAIRQQRLLYLVIIVLSVHSLVSVSYGLCWRLLNIPVNSGGDYKLRANIY